MRLTNYDDELSVAAGILAPAQVRTVVSEGLARTQRSGLCLPQQASTQLGLQPARNAYHPEANARATIFEVKITLLGRAGVFYCLAAPSDEAAVIGRLPLYALGLAPNPEQGSLRVLPTWEYIRI